jgi:two-component system LytT family response regulator
MNRLLRVMVVDDEPLARNGLAALVRQDPELEIVAECGDGASALSAIRSLAPDLVLLDVQMPELDGFEVLRRLDPDSMPAIIFITAYDRFAVKAFDVHALDYLVKPFDDARFVEAISRAKAALRGARLGELSNRLLGLLGELPPARGAYLDRILVKVAGHVLFVRTTDLDWVEAADYCVRLHAAGKTHVIRESMATLEERLDPSRFFRVHRGAIVNLDRIKELQPWFKGEHVVILHDGTRLKLSRNRRPALEARLGQPL